MHFQTASPKLLHIPLAPPRAGTPGEGIYLKLWQEFVVARPEEWVRIFHIVGPIRQRAASVAASFMVYMGCNGGRCFTYEAERLANAAVFSGRENAFIAAWALKNVRNYGVNFGLRTSEYMLARNHPIERSYIAHAVNWKRVPAVTQDDNDVIESMVRWWSSSAAHVMRSIAEPMIEAANRRLMSEIWRGTADVTTTNVVAGGRMK